MVQLTVEFAIPSALRTVMIRSNMLQPALFFGPRRVCLKLRRNCLGGHLMRVSRHLDEIMEQQQRTANLQVVFVDVEKYSKRRTLTQIQVVDALTQCFTEALSVVSRRYVEYAQANAANFLTDTIRLPTGDGAAIVFTFNGLHDIHLSYAKALLESIASINAANPCDKFFSNGWCNCHANFNVRIGVSEGKGILFRDMNGGYNVAGGVVNVASRVMALADQNQILFTEEAYRQIVDMVDDPHLTDRFSAFPARIKHNENISVYQYVDESLPYLNSKPRVNRQEALATQVSPSASGDVALARRAEDLRAEVERYFSTILMPEAAMTAQRDYKRYGGDDTDQSIAERVMELATIHAGQLGLSEEWLRWRARQRSI